MNSIARILLLAIAPSILHAGDWIKVTSPNFVLYTTAREYEARIVLTAFEQARDFFLRTRPTKLDTVAPVTLVSFDTEREYKPFSPKAFTPAYYVADEQSDFVVMCDLEDLRTRAAVHEYVHSLVRHSGLNLPAWLNEGIAEVYSNMEAKDGRILVGKMLEDRVYSLTHQNWMRTPALVAVGHNSPEYNEATRASLFYAQSWMLTHMLMLSPEYAPKFPAFLEKISETGSSQAALAEIYGKSLAELDRATNVYFRGGTLGAAAYKGEAVKVEISKPAPAREVEIGLILARVQMLAGHPEDAAKRLTQLETTAGVAPELDEARAYVAWKKNDREEAFRQLETAMSHGATNWKTYWDYARLSGMMDADRDKRMAALRQAIERKSDFDEAHLMLGRELHLKSEHAAAIAELQKIKTPDPEFAAGMYLMMAYSAASLKRDADARQWAEEARKLARRPEEIAGADALLNHLQTPGNTTPQFTTPTKTDDSDRPTLRHKDPPPPPKKKE